MWVDLVVHMGLGCPHPLAHKPHVSNQDPLFVVVGMAHAPPPMAGGMPDWHVLHGGSTTPPEWLLHNAQPQNSVWWLGLLSMLRPLLERVAILPRDQLDNYRNGTNIEAHPTHPEFWTKCLIPTNYRGLLHGSTRFRFVAKTSNGAKSGKRGYFKLKEGGCSSGHIHMPSQEIYSHRLLCFMYKGPPPEGQDIVCCHMCENRMCLAPWHLFWAPHRANLQGGIVHKKNRHRYHPYGVAE